MCSFCDRDAIEKSYFYHDGQEIELDVCEHCKELSRDVEHYDEFRDKVEEMAEKLFGVY